MGEIRVQVCHALPGQYMLRDVVVPLGTTLQQAVEMSGILGELPGIDFCKCKVGIFGKLKPLDTVLRERDRVEIYRPLVADPKESRRKRAEKDKAKTAR